MIIAAYFPNLLVDIEPTVSYREMFERIGRRQKLTDRQIAEAWDRQYGT